MSTSLEDPDFTTAYTVVTGIEIEKSLPWLWSLYNGLFLELVESVAGVPLVVDREAEFGININVLAAATQQDGYELHTDINAWTALLAASTLSDGDGGELVHILPDGRSVETRLVEGHLYIFDGRNHPHRVLDAITLTECCRSIRTAGPPFGSLSPWTTSSLDGTRPGRRRCRPYSQPRARPPFRKTGCAPRSERWVPPGHETQPYKAYCLWTHSLVSLGLRPMGRTPNPLAAAAEFGARVRRRRLEKEWSIERLADTAGMHWTYVGSVERGERNISLHNICRLAKALGVGADTLVAGLEKRVDARPTVGDSSD